MLREKNDMDFKNRIGKTVSDFDTFINFIESEKPSLSLKRGELGKKDSFKLNQMLYHKKVVSKSNYTQYQYPAIHLMFLLALYGNLYVRANEKGRAILLKTSACEDFKNLNIYEKYIFLLQTYWTKYEFDNNLSGILCIKYIYNFLRVLSRSQKSQWVVKDNNFDIYMLYSKDSAFFYHMNFFGFGDYEINCSKEAFYKDSIKDFIVNDFGIYASRFLIKDALTVWNNVFKDGFISKRRKKTVLKKDRDPFDIFKDFFPEKKVKRTIVYTDEFDRTGVYTFKVSLHNGLWRKINLSHYHYLYDLHMAIQEAFDFDNDHLYAFYVGGNKRTGKPIYCPEVEEKGKNTEEVTIADCRLFRGQKIFYLFDFGDEWWFDIKLLKIDKESPELSRSVIIESQGKSPEQYHYWE